MFNLQTLHWTFSKDENVRCEKGHICRLLLLSVFSFPVHSGFHVPFPFFFFFPFLLIFFYLTLLNLHFLCNVFFEQRSFPLPTRGQVWPSLPHCASLTMQECTVVSSRVSWCRTRHWAFLRSRLRAEKPFYWLHWSLNLRSNPVGPGYKTVNSR